MLARSRLTSDPSSLGRLAVRDAMAWSAALLDRELAMFRQERERIASKQRAHYTRTNRPERLQVMRLRDWSAPEAARRCVLHANTVRGWLRQSRSSGASSGPFAGPVWNRIHDSLGRTVVRRAMVIVLLI